MTSAKLKATYADMPVDAQMSLAYAVGSVPISATPKAVFEAGRSWGLILQNGPDSFCLTAYGDEIMHAEITRKDNLVKASEARARKRAGEAAGGYLDEIGKTDLATLTATQWDTFCERMTSNFMYWRLASK